MIAAWMLYATLVAGLLYAAALVLERAPVALGRPRRWVWAATIAASVALPIAVALRRAPFAGGTRVLPPEAAVAVRRTLEPIVAGGPDAPGALAALAALDAVLIGSWVAASLVLLGMLARGSRALARARARQCVARPEELGLGRHAAPLAAGAPVRLTDDVGPAVTGVLRTEILLPRWCLDLPPGELALVLAHEGEHVRAGDPRLLLAARLAAVAFPWLLPLWWQVRRLRLAVEIDCDARVLRRGFAPPGYGRLLLEVGSRRSTQRDHSREIAALAAPPSQLERRIRAMFHSNPRARWWRAAAAVAVATGLVVVACESPTPFDAESESESGAVATYEASEMPVWTLRLQEVDGTLQEKREFEASLLPLQRAPGEPGGGAPLIRQNGEVATIRLDKAELAEIERRAAAGSSQYRYRAAQTEAPPAAGTLERKKWTNELRETP